MDVRKLSGWKIRLLSAFLSLAIMTAGTVEALAADGVAATMRLTKTEGTVQVSSSSGKSISLIKNMRLYNGYQVETEEKSYAWINLDSTKLVKLDAASEASIRKSGKRLEILLDSGNLYFDVSKPLQDDESLNIRTSTMAVGIRGTSGWLEVLDKQTVLVCVLEGTVEVTVTDPVSGQSKTDAISAGESAIGVVYDLQEQIELGEKCDILRQTYTETDTNGFVLEELAQNKPLVEDIYQESGLDYRDLTPEEAGERLHADQEEVHQKLEELDRAQSSQDHQVSVDQVGKPKPVDLGNSGSSSGGSSSGGNPPEASNRLPATATVPEILAALNRFDTVYVGDGVTSIRPFDAALPVTAGKTLQLDGPAEVTASGSLTVDGTVHAAADLANNGTITVNSRNTLYVAGSLHNQGILSITAAGRAVVDGTISGSVDLIKGAELRFKQHDQLTLPRNWPMPDAPDEDGYYVPQYYEFYKVTFVTDGGSAVPDAEVKESFPVAAPSVTPTRTGYTFDGWYTDQNYTTQYDFSTPVTGNLTLYAKWNPVTYTVTFNSNGGSAVPDAEVKEGFQVAAPGVTPTRPGYTFDGWYTDQNYTAQYDFSTPVTGNLTLYAKWSPITYTVTFNSNGGSAVGSQTVTIGAVATRPTSDPTHPYFSFDNWYESERSMTPYDFSAPVTADLELYAKWWQGTIPTNTTMWRLEDTGTTLILNGEGSLTYNSFDGSAPTPEKTKITTLRFLTDSIEETGQFKSFTALQTVIFPNQVIELSQAAFDGCTSLSHVDLPQGITSITTMAFQYAGLTDIQIPEGVTLIEAQAFSGCTSLANVDLPSTLSEIGQSAFAGCSSLHTVTIPISVMKIGYGAFGVAGTPLNIAYQGTIEQWNVIQFDSPSACFPNDTKIVCTDGTLIVEKDGTGNMNFKPDSSSQPGP